MKILKEVFRKNRAALLVFAVMTAADTAVFALYDILTEPLFYATALSFCLLIVILTAGYVREKRRADERARTLSAILTQWRELPQADTLAETDYQQMIAALGEAMDRLTAESDAQEQDMLDYYTAWVHQIKTPIAVMKLKLADDTPEHRALCVELQRVEQYVDMVLQYIRVGSGTNDLVIR
ncbi:MAG: HAMP domain-containing histidine kinase, partial [Clostridia bacterium]|nr:HAMP domain-containing histidine kinase [Clostridia bacterium]